MEAKKLRMNPEALYGKLTEDMEVERAKFSIQEELLRDSQKLSGLLRELLEFIKQQHKSKNIRLSDQIIHKMKRFDI
jgi:uncharacterized protein YeeX (DUF496 family)